MVTDLVQIRRLGEQKRAENERLRRHLKSHPYQDKKVRKLAETVEEAIDCLTCANCCKVATVRLLERDVLKLAKSLRITPVAFLSDYTQENPEEGTVLRRTDAGCVFLDGFTCTVYESRPATCEGFPHTVRGEGSFVSRMWQFIDRATYCPIVYNTLEDLKRESGFRG